MPTSLESVKIFHQVASPVEFQTADNPPAGVEKVASIVLEDNGDVTVDADSSDDQKNRYRQYIVIEYTTP